MFTNFFKRKMENYIQQAEIFGDMRNAWLRHVFWTREVALSIIGDAAWINSSIAKLLKNPAEIAGVFSPYYPEATVRKIEALFVTHLQQDAEIITAAKNEESEKVNELTKQWYAGATEIANFIASINSYYDKAEVQKMIFEHLRLTLLEVTLTLQGQYDAAIETFDKVQKEALVMADYFARGLVKQFS